MARAVRRIEKPGSLDRGKARLLFFAEATKPWFQQGIREAVFSGFWRILIFFQVFFYTCELNKILPGFHLGCRSYSFLLVDS